MATSIIIVILSICLLAANTRAEQYAGPPSGDEPASSEPVQQQTAQSSDPSSKPAQAQSKEEKRIREIKNRIRQYGRAARITVVLWNDNERYGSLEYIDVDTFQLAEVDINQEVTIAYKDVKKVRRGYGQFNAITGKRVSPTVNLVLKLAVLAFLFIIVPLSVPRT